MPYDHLLFSTHASRRMYERALSLNDLALPVGALRSSETWVESEPLRLPGVEDTCFLLGRVDQLAHFSDGSSGVIDYKTTEISEVNVARYARQLHAYA